MPRRRLPSGILHAAAGTWRGSGPQTSGPLRRIPSPPVELYRRPIDVPIGNDGIAFPATFSGAGSALCQTGPQGVGTTWEPAQAYAYTSLGQTDGSQVTLWVGPAAIAQYQVAANLAGGGAQFPLGGITLEPGWFVFALWQHGTPGATANLIVSGAKRALTI